MNEIVGRRIQLRVPPTERSKRFFLVPFPWGVYLIVGVGSSAKMKSLSNMVRDFFLREGAGLLLICLLLLLDSLLSAAIIWKVPCKILL